MTPNIHSFIKWFATGLIVLATGIRAWDLSHTSDVIIGTIGAGLWMYEGIHMKEGSLYFVNGICFAMGLGGIFNIFFG